MSGYTSLIIYQEAFELALKVHKLTLKLPKFEQYEQGSQVRRSSKSIKDCIAEGYGRKRYKADYIRFLVYARASSDEVMAQLSMIAELYFPDGELLPIIHHYRTLNRKIDGFIKAIEFNN